MMLELTYVHWNDKRKELLLVAPWAIAAVTSHTPREDDPSRSTVHVKGMNFRVAETTEEIRERLRVLAQTQESGSSGSAR